MAMTSAERQRRYMKRLKAASAIKACPRCGKPLAALPGRGRPAAHKAKPAPKTIKAQAAQP